MMTPSARIWFDDLGQGIVAMGFVLLAAAAAAYGLSAMLALSVWAVGWAKRLSRRSDIALTVVILVISITVPAFIAYDAVTTTFPSYDVGIYEVVIRDLAIRSYRIVAVIAVFALALIYPWPSDI